MKPEVFNAYQALNPLGRICFRIGILKIKKVYVEKIRLLHPIVVLLLPMILVSFLVGWAFRQYTFFDMLECIIEIFCIW
jgi:uncharacterized membrane protein AbrB (regulator of aidB expression)